MIRTFGRNDTQTKKQQRSFFLPESIHHIFYWQDCYHWLIYILQQRKYINNSWRRFEELLFLSFFNLGGQGRRNIFNFWRGWEGPSSNRRSYNGTGFASIFAKICGGNGSNWPPCTIGSDGSDLESSSFLTEFFFGQFVRTTLAKVISHSSILSSFPVKWSLKKGRMGYYLVEKFFEWLKLVSCKNC